ncbi:MAG: transglycosylase domain-containing protein [Oscillospiraceae bacterium]|nr:transglycosylase domain-containing protein [Oscillospiraceae bacterium]
MSASSRTGTAGKKQTQKKKRYRRPLILRILGSIGTVLMTTFLSFFLLFAVTGTICAIAATMYITNYMENTTPVSIQELSNTGATNIYEFNKEKGEYEVVYYVQSEQKRIPVTLDQVPQHVRDAFVYGEDERFYEHEGVDFKRTAASFANMILRFWASDQGGSTITQQLVKNLTGDNDKSPQRKIREIHRAMELEKNYSKDDILINYLNYIGFGGPNNGIEMAALTYFGKHVEELSIAEGACLAAIPQSPEINNPFASYNLTADNPVTGTKYYTDEEVNTGREANRTRMEYILKQMYKNGAITFDEYEEALNEHLVFKDTDEYLMTHPDEQKVMEDGSVMLDDHGEQKPTSWAVDEVLNEFANKLMDDQGISRERAMTLINTGGYQIYSTVDQEMQAYLEAKFSSMDNILMGMTNTAATTFFRDLDGDGEYTDDENLTLQAGFTAIDYEGRVLCTCGGIGEKKGSLGTSFASTEPQQPGSAIKPVTSYGYALYNDYITWGTHVRDVPPLTKKDDRTGEEKPWPTNYADVNNVISFSGNTINIYHALERSYNTIPALLVKTYGRQKVFDFATKTLGLELNEGYDVNYAPLAVGALGYGITVKNLVNAYIPYGNGGYYNKAHMIDKIYNVDGSIFYDASEDYRQVIDEETSYVMNKLLQNVVMNGTGTAAQMYTGGAMVPIAGKTGTTSDWFDLMFVGLNPDFASGVWIGYKENKEIKNHWSIASARVWKNIIGEWIVNHYYDEDFTKQFPTCETVLAAPFCQSTGKIAGMACPQGTMGYWKSTNLPWCNNYELNLGFNAFEEDETDAG